MIVSVTHILIACCMVFLTLKIFQNRITNTEVATAKRTLTGSIVVKYVIVTFRPVQASIGPGAML